MSKPFSIAQIRSLLLALGLASFSPLLNAIDKLEEMSRLFDLKVEKRLQLPDAELARYSDLLNTSFSAAGLDLPISQFVLVVDSNDFVQALMLFWITPEATIQCIGAARVSTGKPGRFDHFKTPTGVFLHTPSNPDFRAEGTKNEFGIRGYGIKGMRVYDFGWQTAIRGWGRGGQSQLRLQMHATDPDRLESRLGTAQSKGCVRIPATLNTFIDYYGILDFEYDLAQRAGQTFRVLLPDRQTTPWSGRYLVIVDSKLKQRPVWARFPVPVSKSK